MDTFTIMRTIAIGIIVVSAILKLGKLGGISGYSKGQSGFDMSHGNSFNDF